MHLHACIHSSLGRVTAKAWLFSARPVLLPELAYIFTWMLYTMHLAKQSRLKGVNGFWSSGWYMMP